MCLHIWSFAEPICSGIFVQPRYAKLLSAEALHEAMGHPKGHAKDVAKEEASMV